ncbi:thiamine pyrophosphate-binding protein [Sphingomonas sp.]|uniref:thiamine pyrophosphate-binding protein n=1 Tax=Sphingomonas sp. TaxID=28214 RepID=UPI0025D24776|nr:thiamine pyrophosphate-binding protein [Sphingomonas sp.]
MSSNKDRTAARVLVESLSLHGVRRVFCVPGESYLSVLDALYDSNIELVVARHEGGAAMMADAHGKLTGQPGICMVTRGPGATNASSGVHIASLDATPMILFIGQVARDMRGRGAFQEIDYSQMFGGMAKWVVEIDDAARVSELVSRAFHMATSGRPGPVVVALPEDMLADAASMVVADRFAPPISGPPEAATNAIMASLSRARRPLVIVGGGGWTQRTGAALRVFAERNGLPVGGAFRAQDYLDNRSESYVGDVGLGINPKLAARIRESDWLLLLGTRMDEVPSGGYDYLKIPRPAQFIVHVHQDPNELGRVYQNDIGVVAASEAMVEALATAVPSAERQGWSSWRREARADYERYSTPTRTPGALQMSTVMRHLNETLPDDAIITNGAGNYTVWVHRFYRYRNYRTQLAPVAGSMGYGLPAAIAAKLEHPDRTVVCFAGDGCLQMTIQELGTARQTDVGIIVLVVNNGTYGTIRMHQERNFPGRVSGTDIVNPNFVAVAQAYGLHAEMVERDEDFPAAFRRAADSGKTALVELRVDPQALTPGMTLDQIREAATAAGR